MSNQRNGKKLATGVSPCDICSFGCPITSQIENGQLVSVAPAREHPGSRGFICAKGYASRQYVYKADRIKSPMRRVGKRGEGRFEQVSWDRAFEEIANRLNGYKRDFGADSVAFYSGYTKWYRPYLHRLAHSFGTLNYGTESSSCFQATIVANKCSSGCMTTPDVANAGTIIGWAYNPYYSNLPMPDLEPHKKRGAKIIIVDPKQTPAAARLADVHLRPRPGTDGALALGIARELIHRGFIDRDFIDKYVLGFDEFAEYVEEFDVEKVNIITGVPQDLFFEAVDIITNNSPMCMVEGSAGMIHHTNGVQAFRAVNALIAITGGYGKRGGNRPFKAADPMSSSVLDEERFINQHRPTDAKPKIGSHKYPLWSECIDEFQAMELAGQIMEGKPYPIKALFALGLNARMFPGDQAMFKALESVDFFVDVDIFMSDTAKYADILLPACTSFERDELRASGRKLFYFKRAIEPLYDSRSDTDIMIGLAKALDLDDEHLTTNYDACCRFMLDKLGVDLQQLKDEGVIQLPPEKGSDELTFYTKSGKYELYSALAEKHGYEPLPKYYDPYDTAESEALPLILCSGGRLPNAFASRFHNVPWARELRKDAAVDINPLTANSLGIEQGDIITLYTCAGELEASANLTNLCLESMVCLYHGYSEADVNSIIPLGHNDPYSGFPGYRSVRCGVRLKERAEKKAVQPTGTEKCPGVFSFESEKCVGCGACAVACMDHLNTDLGKQEPLRRVYEDVSGQKLRFNMDFCLHCDEPDCLKACKAAAIKVDNLGLVSIDYDRCIGCGACVRSCKHGGVHMDDKPYKCTGCEELIAAGKNPPCIDACKFGALGMKTGKAAAVILAGGKSSRMGRDKARLPIGDSTFANALVNSFKSCFKNVYLSVGADSDLDGPQVIKDLDAGYGPLSGLYAALNKTEEDTLFLCATDMPFADPKLALILVSALGNHDACLIQREDGQIEFTFAAYSKRALPILEKEMKEGRYSAHNLVSKLDAVLIPEAQLPGEPVAQSLANINTPSEYEELIKKND